MDYTQIEDDIVGRLAPIITAGYAVIAMPDNNGQNAQLTHKGGVVVQVTAAEFKDQQSTTGATVQDEYVYIDLIIRSRKLRSTGGVYDLTNLVKALLVGWTPPDCFRPITAVDFGGINPAELKDQLWTYSLRVMTKTVCAGAADEVVAVLITQITVDDQVFTEPAPTAELFASTYSVDAAGDQAILIWTTTGGDEVSLSGIGVVTENGTSTVTVTEDTTYTLTVTQGAIVVTSEVEIIIGSVCDPVTNQVNGNTIGTTPSGNTHNQLIQNSLGNSVGTADNPSKIADSQAQVNGVNTEAIEATVTHNQVVEDGAGNPIGTAANPSVIDYTTLNINGVEFEDEILPESTYPLLVKLDGVESGTFDIPNKTVNLTSATCVELSVTLSDDEPDFGDTITITGTASGFTPDSYKFFVFDGANIVLLADQVGNTYDYLVNSLEADIEIYVMGVEDGVDIVGGGEFATVQNIPTITDSVHFNGTNNYATVAADNIFDFGTGEITQAIWLKADTVVGNDGIFETSYGSNGIMIRRVGESIQLYLNGGSITINGVGFFTGLAGTWVHMLWTRTAAGAVTLYRDGVSFGTGTDATSLTDNQSLKFGKYSTEYFEGNMLTPFFVDRLLTGAEITEASGTPAADPSGFSFYADIIEYWNFGTGDTIPTLIGGKEGKNATTTNMTAGNIEADVP